MRRQFRTGRAWPWLALAAGALMVVGYLFAIPRLLPLKWTGFTSAPQSQPEPATALTYQHVFVITEENHSEAEIVGNPAAPYINQTLIAHGALATNYVAIDHPDLVDELALTSGSEWGDVEDTTPQAQTYPGPVIADEFQWSAIPWRAYVQGMPRACDLTDRYSPRYDVNHNPFMYFSEVRANPAECHDDVPFTRMATDLRSASTTPAFAYIVPDLENDMDGEGAVQEGDTWLSHEVPVIMGSPACRSSNCLVVVTWDQDDGSESNHVPTIFYGTGVPQGYKSPARYNQYSLLRTIEDNFGLAPMTANDAGAAPMADMLGTVSDPTPAPMTPQNATPATAPGDMPATAPADTSTTAPTDTSTTAPAPASDPGPAATPAPPPAPAPAPPPAPAPAPPPAPTPAPPPAPTPTPTTSDTETNVCLLVVCVSLGL